MQYKTSLLAAALVGFAQAQTPSEFVPNVNAKLDVMFNSTVVGTPGQLLSKAATATQPSLALSSDLLSSSDTYMFVMLDLDVPPANGTTERRVLLHAMITDFKATQQQVEGSSTLLASTATGPAAYLPPGPPATDTKAHRYVELLFQQPAGFNVQTSDFPSVQDRINFDLAAFATENSVDAPVAANFFTVDGRATTAASGTPTTSGGIAGNTLTPFEGAAGRMMLPCGWAASLGAVMLLTM
ncbi:PEBP-like protein, partial [Plenodomus tracheiphilus IPT5]